MSVSTLDHVTRLLGNLSIFHSWEDSKSMNRVHYGDKAVVLKLNQKNMKILITFRKSYNSFEISSSIPFYSIAFEGSFGNMSKWDFSFSNDTVCSQSIFTCTP
jgi:hypothetical protein